MHPKNILIQISIPVNEITYCMHCSSLGILNPYIFMVCAFVCVCVCLSGLKSKNKRNLPLIQDQLAVLGLGRLSPMLHTGNFKPVEGSLSFCNAPFKCLKENILYHQEKSLIYYSHSEK